MLHPYKLNLRRWTLRGFFALLWLGYLPALMAQQRPPLARLAPSLAASSTPRTATVHQAYRVRVQDKAAFEQWLRQYLRQARARQPTADPRLLLVSGVDAAGLQILRTCPVLEFIDVPNRPAHEEQQLDQSDLTVNKIAPVHRRYPQLTGQGLAVSVKENPFDPTDIDFAGRVLPGGAGIGDISAHATAMATYIAGGGNSAPSGKGAAWQARLATASFAELLPDDGTALTQAGISVQNHSYGVGIENYYGLESEAYDAQGTDYPSLLHVFSSGNAGDQTSTSGPYAGLPGVANLTGQFKLSKNTLSVGATDARGQVVALSSRGPAYDGRVKPELVAYGADGTSDAAALVSGSSLLVQQAYRDQHGGTLPSSALVKAALLNSADPPDAATSLSFVAGYGQVDALGAVQTMLAGHFFTAALGQGQEQVVPLTVPAGSQHLKVTLVWTDPAAAPDAGQALVNDLDLELVHPATGQHWLPWVLNPFPHPDSLAQPARRGPDHLNNAEQITLTLPLAGAYELRVRGYAVPAGPQPFALAYETGGGFDWISPLQPANVRPAETTLLRWQWSGPATPARFEYKVAGAAQWQEISAATELAQHTLAWLVPDLVGRAQVRCVTSAATFVSDTFTIARPLALRVGYACAEEAQVFWAAVPGVMRYQLYRLGSTQLEPIAQTADTTALLDRRQSAAVYYAVAPLVQGEPGERGSTIDFTTQGTACYVRSFLPRELVADTVQFDLVLGSLYRLQAVTLERQTPAGFQAVQTISPVMQLAMVLTDPAPGPGRNLYRVRLQDVAGRAFYSELEEVQFTSPDELVAFPNPVAAGQSLSLLVSEGEQLWVTVYDKLGRRLREVRVTGAIKELDTSGLKPGIYLVRARTEKGRQLVRRIVIL